MSTPFPGLKVYIESDGQILNYLNKDGSINTVRNNSIAITNYDYELKLNDDKRKILLIKPEYIGVVMDDIRNIMNYSESSQYVDKKTKRVYNPRIIGK